MPYDSWLTAPDILDRVRVTFDGQIDFDPASNIVAQRYVKAKNYCVAPDDTESMFNQYHDDVMLTNGLAQPWHGNVFCNPPYSAGNIDAFVDKAIAELPNIDQMIILVNSATDSKWYHKLLLHSDCTLLWRGRIKFWKIENGEAREKWEGVLSKEKGLGKIDNSPRYLNTLFYFGSNVEGFMSAFDGKGTFMQRMLHVHM